MWEGIYINCVEDGVEEVVELWWCGVEVWRYDMGRMDVEDRVVYV